MKHEPSCHAPDCSVLKREKRKSDFTATGRDIAACVAAFGVSAVMVTTDKMAEWENVAIEKFAVEKIAPDWTLQQHIDSQQMIGMCAHFFLIYIALSCSAAFLRYLIFDSPLPALFGMISRLLLRIVRWLGGVVLEWVSVLFRRKKTKDNFKPDAK